MLGIGFNIMQPRLRHIIFLENRFNATLTNISFTVTTLIGMDDNHIGVHIETIAGANIWARLVFAAFARFRYD